MIVVGVDPGLSGALAIISEQEIIVLADLPVHMISAGRKGTRAELDLHGLHTTIAEHCPIGHGFIEEVSARPGNGSVGMFRFGTAYGAIQMALVALGIPMTLVQPKAWQRHHGIGPAPDDARQRAVQLYPGAAPLLSRKKDANRADALLIAAYGQVAPRRTVAG